MDCNMPLMDGFEATVIIRRMISDGQITDGAQLYIVALTAYTNEDIKNKCYE
jgi:CheY-like chemotaxis protein